MGEVFVWFVMEFAYLILRSAAGKAARLEGWRQARCLWPSFETFAVAKATANSSG
jgi:hypothetical protein